MSKSFSLWWNLGLLKQSVRLDATGGYQPVWDWKIKYSEMRNCSPEVVIKSRMPSQKRYGNFFMRCFRENKLLTSLRSTAVHASVWDGLCLILLHQLKHTAVHFIFVFQQGLRCWSEHCLNMMFDNHARTNFSSHVRSHTPDHCPVGK